MRPSLRFERQLLRAGHCRVAGIDEVGRGAIAGPVAVGVAVVTAATRSAPQGLRDSKLLTPQQREALFPRLQRWACNWAVGQASAQEVDTWGLTAALRLAALRALQQIPSVDAVVLDGSHDYLSTAAETLFEVVPWPEVPVPSVHRVIKGDRSCSSVAAASVLAKVTRDAVMTRLHSSYPGYCWDLNKGYTTPEHSSAVRALGLCDEHRRSWQVAAAVAHELAEVEPQTSDALVDAGLLHPADVPCPDEPAPVHRDRTAPAIPS